jgi:hypothetical protein
MSDIAQYGSWSVEAATEAAKELNTKGKEALFMKLETGLNAVRFMPPATGTTSPFAIGWQHYLRVPGAERPELPVLLIRKQTERHGQQCGSPACVGLHAQNASVCERHRP